MSQLKKTKLTIVVMDKTYGSNVKGETAGFLPEIAKELIEKKMAHLPGQKHAKAQEDQDDEPVTPVVKTDSVPQGGGNDDLDALKAKYKELAQTDADSRWGAQRLALEIEKLEKAKSALE